jgi:uncharacterized OsmC-like protein
VTPAQLRDLYALKARAIARRPGFARGSGHARVCLGPGLHCEVESPRHALVVDALPEDGGEGRGPDPGDLMTASLGASLAMGYRLWSARLDIPIEGAEIDVSCEYDLRGQLGSGEGPVGWQRLVIAVLVVSPAPEAALRALIEHADRHCPMLANLSPEIERLHRLSVQPSR